MRSRCPPECGQQLREVVGIVSDLGARANHAGRAVALLVRREPCATRLDKHRVKSRSAPECSRQIPGMDEVVGEELHGVSPRAKDVEHEGDEGLVVREGDVGLERDEAACQQEVW